jgi:uncharacterized iron-regulated membrane protein
MQKKKRTVKYWIGQLHLWPGLVSGLVVFVISITGCLFSFQKEISDITYKHTFFVTPQNTPRVPLSVLMEKAQKTLGANQPIGNITTYKDPGRAWEFMAYKANDTAISYFGSVEYYRSVFINPYTGDVTGIRDYKYDFFFIIKSIHWSLLLNTKYGQPIVGWSTVIFIFLLITGLVLWWPKRWNKVSRQKSFGIKWKARIKRLNYDLHNVLGFYSLLLALVLALTGIVWSFQWFQSMVYAVASGSTTPPAYHSSTSKPLQQTLNENPFDIAFDAAVKQLPDAQRIGVSPAYGKEGAIYVFGYMGKETYYDREDLQSDQYSGKLLYRQTQSQRNRGQQLSEMNYDIHVGSIGGLTGKIIAFIISFISASLPVTGFFVWWNKLKRNKKPLARQAKAVPNEL